MNKLRFAAHLATDAADFTASSIIMEGETEGDKPVVPTDDKTNSVGKKVLIIWLSIALLVTMLTVGGYCYWRSTAAKKEAEEKKRQDEANLAQTKAAMAAKAEADAGDEETAETPANDE